MRLTHVDPYEAITTVHSAGSQLWMLCAQTMRRKEIHQRLRMLVWATGLWTMLNVYLSRRF